MGSQPSRVQGSQVNSSNARRKEESENMKKAVREGKQLFIMQDINDNIKHINDIVSAYGDHSQPLIMQLVEKFNSQLPDDATRINESLTTKMTNFHNALLQGLNAVNDPLQTKTDKVKQAHGDLNVMLDALSKTYGKDFDVYKTGLLDSEVFVKNKEIAKSAADVIENIKNTKIKYKFFEYKYIELNIFMILYTEFMYNTMDKFIKNVLFFNEQRDKVRQDIIEQFMNTLRNMIKSTQLNIEPSEIKSLNDLSTRFIEEVNRKDNEFKEQLSDIVKVSSDNISSFVSSLSSSHRSALTESLSQVPTKYNSSISNAETDNVFPDYLETGLPVRGGKKQKGGFIRDGSRLPQAFYELDGQLNES